MIQSNRPKKFLLTFTVMTFLFGGQRSFLQKAKVVAKLAAEHSSNLAAFAGLYKVGKTHYSILVLDRTMNLLALILS